MDDFNEIIYKRAVSFLMHTRDHFDDNEYNSAEVEKKYGLHCVPHKFLTSITHLNDVEITERAKSIAIYYADRGRKGALARKKSITPDLLASYSNQELFAELKRRGYSGTLSLKVEI